MSLPSPELNVESLCQAVGAGDVATVRQIAQARPELVNAQRNNGFGEMTAIHCAVLQRNQDMCRTLMEFNADARAGIWPHRDATSAYAIATDRDYVEIVAVIEAEELRRRKELSSTEAASTSNSEAIQQAILEGRSDDAQRILEADPALIGACSLRGVTPLHVAAWQHDTLMIGCLLERQADANAADTSGQTPLDYAALVAGSSAHGRHYCFMESANNWPSGFDETMRLLLSHGGRLTPRAAVALGDMAAVRQLHREGRLVNDIHVLRGGLLSIAVRVNRLDMLTLLLELGLDPDERIPSGDDAHDSWGMPLWFASMCGRLEFAELLLRNGADVNAIVYASGDAMGNADATEDGPMQRLLRQHGARITVEHISDIGTAQAVLNGTLTANSLNVDNPTLTDLAEQMLWANGGHNPEFVRLCLPHMTRPADDPWWNYVMLHAKLPASLKLLLDFGIAPDAGGGNSYTILQHLASNYAAAEYRIERATLLLDAGASLTVRDPLLKSTPLGWACRWGRLDLVELYLERGANPREPDAEPWARPLAWARKKNHHEIVQLLLSDSSL